MRRQERPDSIISTNMNPRRLRLIVFLIIIGIVAPVIYLQGCAKQEPIRLGFAGRLTGSQSDHGVESRNSVELAIDEVNAAGGINGRPIELLIRDDKGSPEEAAVVDQELIDAGVLAIIGHTLSSDTKGALPVINRTETVMLSPSASSPELCASSPYFFQVAPKLEARIPDFARYIFETRNTKSLAIIYDSDNPVFTKTYRDSFASSYEKLGGKVISTVSFSSKTKPYFKDLAVELVSSKLHGILIIADSQDTALIVQQIHLIEPDIALFSSFWANWNVVTQFGGKAVEGLTLETDNNFNSQSLRWRNFVARYKKSYGAESEQLDSAILGYETVMLLAEALKKTNGSKKGLREALLSIKRFDGLIDTFYFNDNCGSIRPSYVRILRPGRPVIIRTATPKAEQK